MEVASAVLLTVISLAALWDAALMRIPNGLLLVGWLIGLGFSPGIDYVLQSLCPIVLLYPLSSLRMIGAGDVKLLAVICGYLGLGDWFHFLFYFVLCAGGISLLRLLSDSHLWSRFSYFFNYCRKIFLQKNFLPYEGSDKEAASVPLAVAILAGYVWYLVSGQTGFWSL